MFVFMVLGHVQVGSKCTIIFEKSLGMRKHSWCMQFRGRSTDERNFDVRRHRGQSPSVIECHNLLGGCDTRLHLDFDPIGCDRKINPSKRSENCVCVMSRSCENCHSCNNFLVEQRWEHSPNVDT